MLGGNSGDIYLALALAQIEQVLWCVFGVLVVIALAEAWTALMYWKRER